MRVSSKCNTLTAHTLLLQYVKDGWLATEKPKEIRHIGYLKDAGYVEADFEFNDKKQPVRAWITRITNDGETRIEDFSSGVMGSEQIGEDGYSEEQRKAIIANCEEVRTHSSKTYDALVRLISGGGITLAASVAPYFLKDMGSHKGIWLYAALACCLGAVGIWGFNLVYSLYLEWDGQRNAIARMEKAEACKLEEGEEE